MAVKGFNIGGSINRYDFNSLVNKEGAVTADMLGSDVTTQLTTMSSNISTLQSQVATLNDGFANLGTVKVITASVNSSGYTDIPYPSGFSAANAVILGASIYTRYNSWVDFTYDTFTYSGDLLFTASGVRFTPKSAGYATKIRIVLWHS